MVLKLFVSGKAMANFEQLRQYQLFTYFFPIVEQALGEKNSAALQQLITLALNNTDERLANEQRVTPAFLFAAMLWYPLQTRVQQLRASTQLTPQDSFFAAYHEVMSEQQRSIAIPKRFQLPMKDIWILQDKLVRRDGKRAFKTMEHPKFRAGYDFLLLRAEVEGGELLELAKWWTDFQQAAPDTQEQMVKAVNKSAGPRRNTRRRRKPKANTNSHRQPNSH